MLKSNVQSILALIVVTNVTMLPAASPSIGIAMSNGTILVNSSVTPGNATLFSGNTVETRTVSSELQMKQGIRIQLASDSRAKVFDGRAILEKGGMEFSGKTSYEVDASVLKVTATEPNSSTRIAVHGATVEVASLSGAVNVTNGSGVLIKSIAPGMAFDFTPQDAGATPATPPADTTTNKNKKKKAGGMMMGGGNGVAIVAGIAVVAAIGATAGVLATNGDNSSATVSPGH